jgi:hypothetical protein
MFFYQTHFNEVAQGIGGHVLNDLVFLDSGSL